MLLDGWLTVLLTRCGVSGKWLVVCVSGLVIGGIGNVECWWM